MTTAFYRTGTVAVTQNSKVVTGTGTNWTTGPTKPLAGDVFIFNNKMYEIDNVVSDTEIRLYRNFEDSTASSKSYAIMRNASLNISARIAAQVAQVVNQKQIMVDEFHDFLTNNTDSTVPLTDTLGNTINVTPIPMLDKDYVEKIGGIDSAVNQAIQDINDAFDNFEYPVLTAAQRQAIIDANEEKYAASGFVHYGRARVPNSQWAQVNEGMTTALASPNKIRLGWVAEDAVRGASKTAYPVINIAGTVSNLTNENNNEIFSVSLPPAPGGYDIYDSTGNARGTGKANLNLLTEVDPKYGDSAEDLYGLGTVAAKNEASARAFEGIIKNGDLRLGDNGDWGITNDGVISVTDGGLTIENNGQAYGGGRSVSFMFNAAKYKVTLRLGAVVGRMNILIRGGGGYSSAVDASYSNKEIEFEVNGSGGWTWLQIEAINNTAFNSIEVSNISIKPATEEVVTDRVDMFGVEQFDMVMKDGEIFDMIQSQSSTFGDTGVPTVTSVRPDSFFAVYDGQENIVKGKCVRWPDLNRAQKRHIAKYMKERLWVNEDGDLTFTSIRQRSFAGAGNGDWRAIEANYIEDFSFSVGNSVTAVQAQGNRDDLGSTGSLGSYGNFGTSGLYRPINYPDGNINKQSSRGVFAAGLLSPSDRAYKGRCFFYVLGTVSRLNQGAYHPNLNNGGAKLFRQTGLQSARWYEYSLIDQIKTKADCFHLVQDGAPTTEAGAHPSSGYIGAPVPEHGGSGRQDGRLYDAIYADGLGGVVDYRLPAYESDSPEEAAKVWEKVKNGTYRGLERLPFTKVGTVTTAGAVFNDGWTKLLGAGQRFSSDFSEWEGYGFDTISTSHEGCFIRGDDGTIYPVGSAGVRLNTDSACYVSKLAGNVSGNFKGGTYEIILMRRDWINVSVSGNFTHTDVIGDPANILQTDALKNGWQGSWIPVIPDGSGRLPLSRKSLVSSGTQTYTTDNGVSWGSAALPISTTTNDLSDAPAGMVLNTTYTAFAKQTKPSTNKPVLNGEAGVGSVFAQAWHGTSWGGLLSESLIGKVITNSTGTPFSSFSLESVEISLAAAPIGGISEYRFPKHAPLTLGAPNNNSPAMKALPYQISNNGQCSLGIQANELTWTVPSLITIEKADSGYSNWVEGQLYFIRIDNCGLDGLIVQARNDNSFAQSWEALIPMQNGDVLVNTTLAKSVFRVWDGSGWGDDGTMKITDSGSDTFVDLNGNTNLSVVHELALPYGWTKNRARAGEQIEGVDL